MHFLGWWWNVQLPDRTRKIFGVLSVGACSFSLIEFADLQTIKTPCILGIVLSTTLFLNSILGCCGIGRKSTRLSWMHSIIMLLLFMCQIAVIFFEPVNFGDIANEIINKMWSPDLASDYKMTMYETKHECCGKFGPNDYAEIGTIIPLSCYLNNDNTSESNLFTVGCVTQLTEIYSINQKIEEISDWAVVGLEGFSAFIAAVFAISLKNIQRRKLYN